MKTKVYILLILMLFFISGCSLIKKVPKTELDKKYTKLGWKQYYDRQGNYSIYYPSRWHFEKGGKDFVQIHNFNPNKVIPSERFSGVMIKTEIYWQALNDQDLEFHPEIIKNNNGQYQLGESRFTINLNGIHAERWSGMDVLAKLKKLEAYDPHSVQETDLTTEIVTRNILYMIVTYTSGDKNKVPIKDILLLHNSFSF